jgi:Cu(I)/Ag(I) efflux system periplasmic protein CusF
MKPLLAISAVAALFVGVASVASGQSGGMKGMDMKDMDMKGMDMKGMDKGAKKAPRKSHQAAGKVKSVDTAKGTVTIDHGPVASMNWPAMTMTFKAKDKKMLEGVKAGQNIEIDFQQQGKDHVITKVK